MPAPLALQPASTARAKPQERHAVQANQHPSNGFYHVQAASETPQAAFSPQHLCHLAGGYYREGVVQQREPNELDNLFPYACGGANATAAFGAPIVWGWADTNCRTEYVFMCKNASRWQQRGVHRCLRCGCLPRDKPSTMNATCWPAWFASQYRISSRAHSPAVSPTRARLVQQLQCSVLA